VALETTIKPDNHGVSLGTDFMPNNPYYRGVGVHLGYQYYFNKNFSWEVLRGAYFFPIQTDLTTSLAENYNVMPKRIEKTIATAKTNFKYYFIYGKTLLFDDYIRYFRLGFIVGGGMRYSTHKDDDNKTKSDMTPLFNLGLSLEHYISESMLMTIEFYEAGTIKKDWETFPTFTLGFKVLF